MLAGVVSMAGRGVTGVVAKEVVAEVAVAREAVRGGVAAWKVEAKREVEGRAAGTTVEVWTEVVGTAEVGWVVSSVAAVRAAVARAAAPSAAMTAVTEVMAAKVEVPEGRG